MAIKKIVQNIQNSLQKNANQKTQKELTKYMKDQVEFRGLRYPQVTQTVDSIWKEQQKNFTHTQKIEILDNLFKSQYSEDKLAGILVLQSIKQDVTQNDMEKIKQLIQKGFMKDWATIDSLSMRFISKWTEINKENTIFISKWSQDKDHLWVRRASSITFVNRAKYPDTKKPNFKGFGDLMFEISQNLIQHDERFNQLGCGWLLRNLTLSHKQRTLQFIEDNYNQFSREGLRYAIEKLDQKERQYYLNFNKSKIQEKSQNVDQQEEQAQDEQQNIKKPKKTFKRVTRQQSNL